MTKIKSVRHARRKFLRPSRRKPRNHRLTDEPRADGASQISTRRYVLQAELLTVKPPAIGMEPPSPPGVHNLKAALSKRSRKRSSPNLLIYRSKTGKPRHVLLTDEGAALFAGWCAGRAGSDLIFHTARGQPWGRSMQFAPNRPPAFTACATLGRLSQ